MHALIRKYEGLPGLGRRFAQHREEIEKTISRASGFVAFYLIDLPDGTVGVTLCRGKEGVDEALRLGADWIQEHMPELADHSPTVSCGEVVIEAAGVHVHR